jgi:hypothetical protein
VLAGDVPAGKVEQSSQAVFGLPPPLVWIVLVMEAQLDLAGAVRRGRGSARAVKAVDLWWCDVGWEQEDGGEPVAPKPPSA